nr:transcription termination/antitermination NusG family protein [uncultured Butyrivibrio sp.]
MLCIVYSGEDKELHTEQLIEKILSKDMYKRCFHPMQHMVMKRHGQLFVVARKLLPGYVFIETDYPDQVRDALDEAHIIPLFSNKEFVPYMSDEESKVFTSIIDEAGLVPLSVATTRKDENGRTRANFLSGPLSNIADKVTKVDFTKRKAYIDSGLSLFFTYDGEKVSGEKFWRD